MKYYLAYKGWARSWDSPGSKPYNPKELIKLLKGLLKYIKEADDAGSVDHAFGRLQDEMISIERIADKNGGI